MDYNRIVVCRGGGDLATGIIHRLAKAGLQVVCLESERPSSIRRQVCFSEAVYDGETYVDGMKAVRVKNMEDILTAWQKREVPVLIDPKGEWIEELKPVAVVDTIIAKKNLGTYKDMAPFTIGVGPGFTAGSDVDVVIESMRGHNLGRVITKGAAIANTGIPGKVGGYDKERVIHASGAGYMKMTGRVDILDYKAVVDCGIPINPALARIQTEGGLVQGIGHTLMENVTYNRIGRPMECNFAQYKLPTRLDMGKLQVEFEHSYEPTGPFGAKSIGEIVINTPAPAIAHAIYRATGVWHRELPITPEQIALGKND